MRLDRTSLTVALRRTHAHHSSATRLGQRPIAWNTHQLVALAHKYNGRIHTIEKNDNHTTKLAPLSIAPLRRMSSDDDPINILNDPGTTDHACLDTSQIEKLRSSRVNATVAVSPGSNHTFLKPFNCFGGSPAAAGNPTYNC